MSAPPGAFAADLAALCAGPAPTQARTATRADVRRALRRVAAGDAAGDLKVLATLLSEAADPDLEEIAAHAAAVTVQRFGRAVRLFAPLYLSNACLSRCTYCGFAAGLDVVRRTLTLPEVEREAAVLRGHGFQHLLLVSGEHRREVSPDYVVRCVSRLAEQVAAVSVETQTWSDDTYARLVEAGCEGVVHYQETYDRVRYAQVHERGWKRDFDRRLAATERAAAAGVRRVGIGALLGLATDWRADVLATAAHAGFLVRRYWRTEVSVALPRIKPNAAGFAAVAEVTDRRYVQALAALRLFEPHAAVVVSTRETPAMRDGLIRIAATTLSAGSSTEPGGYTDPGGAQEQFALSDERSPDEVAAAIRAAGYEPVWKDAFPLRTAGGAAAAPPPEDSRRPGLPPVGTAVPA